mgnify:CR=1 FL=1
MDKKILSFEEYAANKNLANTDKLAEDEIEIEVEKEDEDEKEAETESQGYQLDYLSANDSSHHVPSLGFGLSAFGQEGVLFRPSVQESLW